MYGTRIVYFGTRGQELTSCHLEQFVRHGANIVAFVEAPPGSIVSTHKAKDPYDGIDVVAARLKVPLLSPKNPNDPAFIASIRDFRPDIIVVNCYQFFLHQEILAVPPLGAVNFHASFLPRHAGMHPIFWTIWYGDRETGMVVHFLDGGIDTGDVIYRTRVPVMPGDTVNTLYHRIFETSMPLVKRFLDDLEARRLPRTPQDMSQYFYNYEIEERDYELDFRQPAEVLLGRVQMLPGRFYFTLGGATYFVNECSVVDEHRASRRFFTGRPVAAGGHLVFATPRRFLRIESVTRDGRQVDPLSLLPQKENGRQGRREGEA
jgi:methionyl-tRNA formyltransferase